MDGLAAATDLDVIVTGIGNPISFDGTFQTLTTAKVSYVNTSDADFRITAVPEPGSIAAMLFAAAPFAMRRRRNAELLLRLLPQQATSIRRPASHVMEVTGFHHPVTRGVSLKC
jgi:hypothetical protein